MKKYDVAIVGAGIVGLAHAFQAAKRGLKAIIFERTEQAEGASVRNFGMVWPIGQNAGDLYDIALLSRQIWLELNDEKVVEVEECGSIHLAHHPDEMILLEEFVSQKTHQSEIIDATEVINRSVLANESGLLGGMYSPTELRINPRTAPHKIAHWLLKKPNVEIRFNTSIIKIESNRMISSDGRSWEANKIMICSGSDLKTLYPDEFIKSDLVLCKLQMLKSVSQKKLLNTQTPHLASGLTLRHYSCFENCLSLEKLKQRIQSETPELDLFGIHVLASQFPNGEVILGDSHEYGDQITPFNKTEIDELMIRELKKVIKLDDWTIRERWYGVYAKHPELPVFDHRVDDCVSLFVGTSGAGMTMAFGLADRYWNNLSRN